MTNAQRNRQEAMGMLAELYLPDPQQDELSNPHRNLLPGQNVTSFDRQVYGLAGNINKLTQLGRTARWQSAINRWHRLVLESKDPKTLRWAFLQGMIYAGHASE